MLKVENAKLLSQPTASREVKGVDHRATASCASTTEREAMNTTQPYRHNSFQDVVHHPRRLRPRGAVSIVAFDLALTVAVLGALLHSVLFALVVVEWCVCLATIPHALAVVARLTRDLNGD